MLRCIAVRLPSAPLEDTPSWLIQCVAHGQYASRDSLKLSFLLMPHERSRLPELPHGANRLSAPRALKVCDLLSLRKRSPHLFSLRSHASRYLFKAGRVAAHVERTLVEAGANLIGLGVGVPCSEGGGGACGVQLYCGEKALPAEMSLLTARHFYWRQAGDMLLAYCAKRELHSD